MTGGTPVPPATYSINTNKRHLLPGSEQRARFEAADAVAQFCCALELHRLRRFAHLGAQLLDELGQLDGVDLLRVFLSSTTSTWRVREVRRVEVVLVGVRERRIDLAYRLLAARRHDVA